MCISTGRVLRCIVAAMTSNCNRKMSFISNIGRAFITDNVGRIIARKRCWELRFSSVNNEPFQREHIVDHGWPCLPLHACIHIIFYCLCSYVHRVTDTQTDGDRCTNNANCICIVIVGFIRGADWGWQMYVSDESNISMYFGMVENFNERLFLYAFIVWK